MVSPGSEVLFSIGMCFLLAFVFSWLNLSSYMGAFFAGSMIASTKYYTDVSLYIKPLSNLFSGVFFVSMGMMVDPTNILPILPIALVISFASMIKFFGGFVPLYIKKAPIYDAIAGGTYLLQKDR